MYYSHWLLLLAITFYEIQEVRIYAFYLIVFLLICSKSMEYVSLLFKKTVKCAASIYEIEKHLVNVNWMILILFYLNNFVIE